MMLRIGSTVITLGVSDARAPLTKTLGLAPTARTGGPDQLPRRFLGSPQESLPREIWAPEGFRLDFFPVKNVLSTDEGQRGRLEVVACRE
jgi:hypothetical protein